MAQDFFSRTCSSSVAENCKLNSSTRHKTTPVFSIGFASVRVAGRSRGEWLSSGQARSGEAIVGFGSLEIKEAGRADACAIVRFWHLDWVRGVPCAPRTEICRCRDSRSWSWSLGRRATERASCGAECISKLLSFILSLCLSLSFSFSAAVSRFCDGAAYRRHIDYRL